MNILDFDANTLRRLHCFGNPELDSNNCDHILPFNTHVIGCLVASTGVEGITLGQFDPVCPYSLRLVTRNFDDKAIEKWNTALLNHLLRLYSQDRVIDLIADYLIAQYKPVMFNGRVEYSLRISTFEKENYAFGDQRMSTHDMISYLGMTVSITDLVTMFGLFPRKEYSSSLRSSAIAALENAMHVRMYRRFSILD